MAAQQFDVAVLGLGAIGSQTLLHLSRGGVSVVGVDQFAPPHSHGSSHGLSRLIRMAYFEHPSYVPLLKKSYQLWTELEEQSGESLWERCGLLEGGLAGSPLVSGLQLAAREHGIDLPHLSSREVKRRFPGFHLPSEWELFFESEAGYLRPEACISAALNLRHGGNWASRLTLIVPELMRIV